MGDKGSDVPHAAAYLPRDEQTGDPRTQALRRSDPIGYVSMRLRSTLRSYPNVHIQIEDDLVSIPRMTSDGPDVSVFVSASRCSVAIASWYEDMPSLDMAIEYATQAVKGTLRVRIDTLGGKPWKYVLERLVSDGDWQEESAVVFPRVTLWKREVTSRYLQNPVSQ
jgi:hypothetical protein